jgi:hypothetical protein
MPPLVIAEVAYGGGLLGINPHLHNTTLDATLGLLKSELWKIPRKTRLEHFPHTCVRQPVHSAQLAYTQESNRLLLPVLGVARGRQRIVLLREASASQRALLDRTRDSTDDSILPRSGEQITLTCFSFAQALRNQAFVFERLL